MAGKQNSPKKTGFVFIQRFADWEFGFLAGSANDWFGARTFAVEFLGLLYSERAGQLTEMRTLFGSEYRKA